MKSVHGYNEMRRDELERTRICAYLSMHETLYRSFVSSLSQGVECVVVGLPSRNCTTCQLAGQQGSIAFARLDNTVERNLRPGVGRGET